MSWTRFDDNWSDRMSQLGMTFQTRVHYMSMIQFCSRTDKFDGLLRVVDARRASDVDDPQACIDELVRLELVTRHVTSEGERLQIVEIDQHVPPPHLRERPRKASGQVRTNRWRLHKAGDHSLCLPKNCPEVDDTSHVTRHLGTGQDGPGREELQGNVPEQRTSTEPSTPLPPCDLSTGELSEPGPYKPCLCGDTTGTCTTCFDDEPAPAPHADGYYPASWSGHDPALPDPWA